MQRKCYQLPCVDYDGCISRTTHTLGRFLLRDVVSLTCEWHQVPVAPLHEHERERVVPRQQAALSVCVCVQDEVNAVHAGKLPLEQLPAGASHVGVQVAWAQANRRVRDQASCLGLRVAKTILCGTPCIRLI